MSTVSHKVFPLPSLQGKFLAFGFSSQLFYVVVGVCDSCGFYKLNKCVINCEMFIVFLLNAIVSFTAVLYYGGSLIDFQFDHFEGNFTVCLHNGNHEGEINFSAKSTRFALAFTKSADIIVVLF